MTQAIGISHPHATLAHKHAGGTQMLTHAQAKNSLRSDFKIDQGKIKAGVVRLSLNALTVCLSAFGYLWPTQAGRQAETGRGAGDETTASSELHCSSAASPAGSPAN